MISVFWCGPTADTPFAEYDGWRRGTKGRGGWGARGNLVSCFDDADAGPVGDFREAAASEEMESALDDWAFFAALRCLRASSLWCRVMRIDLLAGAISSARAVALDLERVWREGLSRSSSRVGDRSLSESDVMAVEVDAIDSERLVGCFMTGCATLELRLLRTPFSLRSGAAEARDDACAATFFRRARVKVREML